MTTNETIQDVIFVCENCGCPTKTAAWMLDKYLSCCPERKPVMRKIVDADTVSAAVREVEQAIANQTKTMRGIAALITGRGYDMISAEDQEEAWMREALRLERATDKALAALRGLGE